MRRQSSSPDLDNVSGGYDNAFENGAPAEPLADYLDEVDSTVVGILKGRTRPDPVSRTRSQEYQPSDDVEAAHPQSRGSVGSLTLPRNVARHRRTKSYHINGFDFYRLQKLKGHLNPGYNPDSDNEDRTSVESLNVDNWREARKLISTMKIKRRSRKSSRKSTSAEDEADLAIDLASGETEEEEVGLPSSREKLKGLSERLLSMKQKQSAREVASQYRSDSLWTLENEGTTSFSRGWKQARQSFDDIYSHIDIWSKQFREIEGHFGTSTCSYFRFTRWLCKINFLVLLLFLGFIYIPQLSYDTVFSENRSRNQTFKSTYDKETFDCSNSYIENLDNITDKQDDIDRLLNVALGTGFLENTMLFYGYYSNLTFLEDLGSSGNTTQDEDKLGSNYNMGLAYILTVGFSFIILFFLIVKKSSNTIKETLMDFDNQAFPTYTNLVFGGWDYCINRDKTAKLKQNNIYREFKAELEEDNLKKKRQSRTSQERVQLYIKRIFINIIVIILLGGSFVSIFLATDFLLDKQSEKLSFIVSLLIQYLPSIIISVLNLVIPEFFLWCADKEEYSHNFATRITIVRAVFLRLAMVGVLIVSLYYNLQYDRERIPYTCEEEDLQNVTVCCGNYMWTIVNNPDPDQKGSVKCWETYVGQQFYKLAVADFAAVSLNTLLHKLPRKLIVPRLKHINLVAKIGLAEFVLPTEVLDIVYTQTLCWIGMFFTPLMPAITFLKVFYLFFLKKFEVMFMCESPKNIYKASKSYSFFQTILLVSFIMIAVLLGYMIGNIKPSKSCGPFRLYSEEDFVMFNVVSNQVNSWPSVPKRIVSYLGSVGFFLPACLLLIFFIYYNWTTTQGYKKMEELLKLQVKSEAYDKQYLLARVDEVIKRGQLVT